MATLASTGRWNRRPLKRATSFHEFPGPSCNGSWFEVPLNPWKWEEFWFTAPALWMCKRTSMCQGHSRARKAKIRNWCTLVIWGVPSWKKPFRVLSNEKPSTCQATPKLTSQSINEHCPMFCFFAGVGLVWPVGMSLLWLFHTNSLFVWQSNLEVELASSCRLVSDCQERRRCERLKVAFGVGHRCRTPRPCFLHWPCGLRASQRLHDEWDDIWFIYDLCISNLNRDDQI